jgi:hypothetical protein
MDKTKLFDALDGLYAYDTGCTDSGIHNESLRKDAKTYLKGLSTDGFRILMTEFIRQYFVSEKAVAKGYGIEDVRSFIEWLSDSMDIDI